MGEKLVHLPVRIDPAMDQEIKKRAVRSGATVSDFVRQVLRDALTEQQQLAQIRLRIAAHERETASLREDLALSLEAVLFAISSEGNFTEDEAREVVNTHLRRREPRRK